MRAPESYTRLHGSKKQILCHVQSLEISRFIGDHSLTQLIHILFINLDTGSRIKSKLISSAHKNLSDIALTELFNPQSFHIPSCSPRSASRSRWILFSVLCRWDLGVVCYRQWLWQHLNTIEIGIRRGLLPSQNLECVALFPDRWVRKQRSCFKMLEKSVTSPM